MTFGPYPRDPLPFPSIMIASRNDPFGEYAHAEDIANAWGSFLIDAGESGHINAESGHGHGRKAPWSLPSFSGASEPRRSKQLLPGASRCDGVPNIG